jgi:hypothetical protein
MMLLHYKGRQFIDAKIKISKLFEASKLVSIGVPIDIK